MHNPHNKPDKVDGRENENITNPGLPAELHCSWQFKPDCNSPQLQSDAPTTSQQEC